MRPATIELVNYLGAVFPEMAGNVLSKVDRPPEQYIMLSQFTSSMQIFGTIFLFFGESILQSFGVAETPSWAKLVMENKMPSFLTLFMVNNFAAGMLATGAFEVYCE